MVCGKKTSTDKGKATSTETSGKETFCLLKVCPYSSFDVNRIGSAGFVSNVKSLMMKILYTFIKNRWADFSIKDLISFRP